MANWTMIVCGIATMISAVGIYYLTNSDLFEPLKTPYSEQWNPVYVLSIGFIGLGLFIAGIFKNR
jgi:hypothetical protein